VHAEDRNGLQQYCVERGIECKVHYPIPLYRQEGLRHLGYRQGDFPVADAQAESVLSFPCDQHLSREEQDHVIATVRAFYGVSR
jgi:dTDP-3-amino-2,3,6-trideoxy-4-keto-D-glucose/dTDP-3-amino-3,4,6-trideoxy-alpha-D-glucose/dTDP-2,6-dideoxy-D-kanosamine transaminase